jgi:hypothetical protein
MQKQVLPYFGSAPLNKITSAIVREWVSTLLSSGLSAATTRKAGFLVDARAGGVRGVHYAIWLGRVIHREAGDHDHVTDGMLVASAVAVRPEILNSRLPRE